MFNILTSILICVGITPDQRTELTITIKPDHTFSTIRYEYLVNVPGTKYTQTLGHFYREQDGDDISYVGKDASSPERATRLTAMVHNGMHIMHAKFTHMNSRVNGMAMDCKIKMDDDGSHGDH